MAKKRSKKATAKPLAKQRTGTTARKAALRAKHNPAASDQSHITRDAKSGAKEYGPRADKGAPATVAIDRMPEPHRTIARAADAAIRSLSHDIDAKISWGNAGYKVDGHDLFALCENKRCVSLYFGNGALLATHDEANLLEGAGKMLRHVKLFAPEDASSGSLLALMRAALQVAKAGSGSAYRGAKSRPAT
jgi:hypothetical protein